MIQQRNSRCRPERDSRRAWRPGLVPARARSRPAGRAACRAGAGAAPEVGEVAGAVAVLGEVGEFSSVCRFPGPSVSRTGASDQPSDSGCQRPKPLVVAGLLSLRPGNAPPHPGPGAAGGARPGELPWDAAGDRAGDDQNDREEVGPRACERAAEYRDVPLPHRPSPWASDSHRQQQLTRAHLPQVAGPGRQRD